MNVFLDQLILIDIRPLDSFLSGTDQYNSSTFSNLDANEKQQAKTNVRVKFVRYVLNE